MKRSLFVFVLAALILGACGVMRAAAPAATEAPAFESPEFYDAVPPGEPAQESFAPAMPAPTSGPAYDQSNADGSVNAAPVERIVIRNADLTVVIPDVEKRLKEVEIMAADMGGFVVSSSMYQYAGSNVAVPEASIVIRVPAERLDDAIELIVKDAVEVRNKNITGTDVTAEYVDLQSRLKNLEAAEAQLQEILENAEKTEDVINVFNQLVYYREQIEMVRGQIKYYDEAAALSSVSVHLIAEETIQPVEIAGWKPQGVAREALQDLIFFFQDFADFLIRFAIYILPVLLTVAVPLYLVFLGARAVFRRSRRNRVNKEVLPPAETK